MAIGLTLAHLCGHCFARPFESVMLDRLQTACLLSEAIDITLTDDRITGIGHKVQGCALCQASAALIAAEVVGATGSEISAASEQLTKFIADEDDAVELSWPKMAVFAPVREFKNRLECLKLPFTAVLRAISNVKNPPAGEPGSD